MERPNWALDNGRIDEGDFCQEFLLDKELAYMGGAFFTKDGRISDTSQLKREIYQKIRPFVYSGVARKVDNILAALKLESARAMQPVSDQVIHVANGTYHLTDGFKEEKLFCRHRLPVNYRPMCPQPETWLRFLDALLEEEDIWTLQQFMGYCLIPSNAAQKMLMIIGKGGEGKSRIGIVLQHLLGSNMKNGSIAKVEHSPFARADLEHVLLMVDDDLKMEALQQTNYIKSIITAEQPMDLERKGEQSYQGQMYARFLAFGNGNLRSLHDRSNGFFRRQLILTTKDRDPSRVDDPYLAQKLIAEIDGIFYWCLSGLYCLIGQGFQFTVSEKTRQNMANAREEGNNVLTFLKSEGYFRFDPEGKATSRALYGVYRDWCADNLCSPLGQQSFLSFLRQHGPEYKLQYSSSIPGGNSRYVRGFQGISLNPRM